MFVADRDSLLRVVYVTIRDGLPPPGLGAYQCGSKAAAFSPRHLLLPKQIETICHALKRSQRLPGADSSSEANRLIGDLVSHSTENVEESERVFLSEQKGGDDGLLCLAMARLNLAPPGWIWRGCRSGKRKGSDL
jgi:hypothetical protein